jgi:uncharacterized protein (UPF0248 family)
MPTNGKTILIDAISLCSDLSTTNVDSGNAIASTHSYVFDEKTPWNVVRDVADACQTSGGAVGFDGYVDSTGDVHIFPRNSSNSTVDLTDKILRYKIDYDTYRVKNKIKVYGSTSIDKTEPSNGDAWTETTLTDWVLDVGAALELVTGGHVGSNYIRATSTADTKAVRFHHPTSPVNFNVGKKAYGTLSAYLFSMSASDSPLEIWLYAPDSSNYFTLNTGIYGIGNFSGGIHKYELGEANEYDVDKNPNGQWHKVGSPKWSDLHDIVFNVPTSNTIQYYVGVDGLHFENGTWNATASDSTSQGLYGVRMPEPVTDDSLASDADCTKKAQSLLSYYKDKVTTLTLTTFGDNNFKPGDRLHVVLSNDNIDDYFRILEVRHTLQDVLWQTELLLSNEPIMIDYIFRKIVEAQKTIASNQ